MTAETDKTDYDFRLNPALDVADLAKAYARKRRLQVRDVFTPDTAERLARCLDSEVPWGFACHDGKPVHYRAEEMAQMDNLEKQALIRRVYAGAKHDFQYAYACYPILDAYLQKWNEVPLLDHFLEFLNSEDMLGFIRTLTGREDIIKGDAQATRFGPGHFLTAHTDDVKTEYRVAAYVFNFTRSWAPDWGGYLQFYDGEDDIEQAFLPRFNALNIFTVPQKHSVSHVPTYAGGARNAITGWFRFR